MIDRTILKKIQFNSLLWMGHLIRMAEDDAFRDIKFVDLKEKAGYLEFIIKVALDRTPVIVLLMMILRTYSALEIC